MAGIRRGFLPDLFRDHQHGEKAGVPGDRSGEITADLFGSGDSVFYCMPDRPGYHLIRHFGTQRYFRRMVRPVDPVGSDLFSYGTLPLGVLCGNVCADGVSQYFQKSALNIVNPFQIKAILLYMDRFRIATRYDCECG